MIPDLSLSSYRIFNAVAELGNITKAAKELYISQPAISKAISRLEQELSVTLFSRTSRGVHLTEEGQILYSYTKDAFLALSEGEQRLRRIHSLEIGHLRIGTSSTLCKYLLLPYLKDFVPSYPHIRFTIQCQSTRQTLNLLSDNKVDIGFIGCPVPSHSVIFFPTNTIEDIFVASPAYLHNLKLREGELTTSGLLETATVMLLDEDNITRQYIDDYFLSHHIRTRQLFEVSSMDLLIDFAKTGLGIACVIREFVAAELQTGSLVELSLPEQIKQREVGFAYESKQELNEPSEKFLSFIHSKSVSQRENKNFR